MVLWWTKLVLYDHCTDPKDQWSYVERIWFFVTIVMVQMTNGPMMNQIGFFMTIVLIAKTNGPTLNQFGSLWPLWWSNDQWSSDEPNWFFMTIAPIPKTNGPMLNQFGSLWPLWWPQWPMVLWWTKSVLYDHCTDPIDQWSHVEPIWFFMTIVIAPMNNGPMMNQIGSLWPLYWSQRSMVLCWTNLFLFF